MKTYMKKILTLWDIDGNLVNVYKYHTPAYQKAIEIVYGVKPSFSEIEHNYGLPAREVIAIPVRAKGISEETIQKGMEHVFSIYSKRLESGIKTALKDSKLPGVLDLLEKLKSLNIPRGIVSGNIKKAGEAILAGSNLYRYFDPRINSYGDDVSYRYEIVSNAIKSARDKGIIEGDAKIYVFGDTPADVEAAKKNECVSIAVIKNSNDTSSSFGGKSYYKRKKALEKSEPDYLFDDYTDIENILSALKVG